MAQGHRNRPRTALQIQRQLATSTDSDDELFLSPSTERRTPPAPGRAPFGRPVGVGPDTPSNSPGEASYLPVGLPGYNNKSHTRRERHDSTESFRSNASSGSSFAGPGSSTAGSMRRSHRAGSCSSIVDGLLFDIYDRWHFPQRDSLDSDTFTECSSTSDAFFGRTDSLHLEFEQKHSARLNRAFLEGKDLRELKKMKSELQHRTTQMSTRLVRQLKRRDSRLVKVNKNCDVITAVLQASSLKRRIDSKIRFSIEPLPGDDAFNQWRDAMKAVARLPMGIPPEFRKKVWLALADNHLQSLRIDWEKTKRFAFNERSNPDDNKLGLQIVKDLHRTGCSGFSGQDNDEERAVLKRVLLAYARWNKAVGYCQGFNVLAALILEVVNRREDDALKVMIFLVDHVLPDSYFANNLRALSVDMAVFRDLLALQFQELSKHLDHLQNAARDLNSGANYEPPLTNVFTMQWFLTLFATCLPEATALRVWDSVLLEGSEILLRTALAIWGKLSDRIMAVQSADEFYTTMGVLTQEMLDCRIVDGDELIKAVYTMAPVPFPQLSELREKYTYNITPFQAAMSTGRKPTKAITNIFSDDDEIDEEDIMDNINCFTGIFPQQPLPSRSRQLGDTDRSQSGSSFDVSKISPGAYAAQPENIAPGLMAYAERMSLDLSQLKRQYGRLRERQKQAHIILAAASARHYANTAHRHGKRNKPVIPAAAVVAPIESPVAVNHLFIGRRAGSSSKRNRTIAQAPNIVPLFPNNNIPTNASFVYSNAKVKPDTSDSRHSGKPGKTSRMLSNESTDDSFSNTSVCTIGDMDRTESYSDVSTVEGDHPAGDLDLIELDLEQERRASGSQNASAGNSDDANAEGADSGCSTEGSPIHTPDRSSQAPTQNETAGELTRKPDNDSGSETDSSSPSEPLTLSGVIVNDETETETDIADNPTSNSDNEESEITSNKIPAEQKTLNFEGNSITQGPNFRAETKSSTAESAQNVPNGKKPTLLQLAQGSHSVDNREVGNAAQVSKSKQASDLEVEYMRQRALRAGQRVSSASTDSNPSPSSSPTSPQSQKRLFNPFPSQHINQRRTQNGIRLGLYSANNLPKLETGMVKSSAVKHIGRAQLNACLHRQYMAEIKQQARVGKR